MAEPEHHEQSFNNATDLVTLCDSIVYYVNLKMAAIDKKTNFRMPANVDKIIELARSLPPPTVEEWGSLAVGRISTKRKFKGAAGIEEQKTKVRAKWSEKNKRELVDLVDNEDRRKAVLGDKANHAGHINWTALARRYGFAGAGPLYRQYQLMTGREPPGVKQKIDLPKRNEFGEGDDDDDNDDEDEGPVPVPLQMPSLAHMWNQQNCELLVKLVDDIHFRKERTGKEKLKWSRISELLGLPKKECKAKYTELTGRSLGSHD